MLSGDVVVRWRGGGSGDNNLLSITSGGDEVGGNVGGGEVVKVFAYSIISH